MCNPETWATLGTRHAKNEELNKTKTARQKTKKDEQDGPHQKPWVNQGAREG